MAPVTQLCSTNRTMARVGRIEDYIKGACEHLNSLTEDVCMTTNQDVRQKGLERLKAIEADILEVQRDITQFQSAYEATADCVKIMMDKQGADETNVNAVDILADNLQVLRDNIEPIRSTDNFKKYEQLISHYQNKVDKETTEALQQQSPAEESSSQADTVITSADIQTHCPYTGQVMTDPVRNLICGHFYDRVGINELLKNVSRLNARCPVSMCRNSKPVQPRHIVADPILKQKIIDMNLI